jgi:hypothetical protein
MSCNFARHADFSDSVKRLRFKPSPEFPDTAYDATGNPFRVVTARKKRLLNRAYRESQMIGISERRCAMRRWELNEFRSHWPADPERPISMPRAGQDDADRFSLGNHLA